MTDPASAPRTAPALLRVEHLDRPLGTGDAAPRLSWRLPGGSTAQSAYEVEVDDLRAHTADLLVGLVRAAGTQLGTGLLATPSLLPVLADTGHLDLAYELLAQDTPPSWLSMVERGATTVWEDWEGVDAGPGTHAYGCEA